MNPADLTAELLRHSRRLDEECAELTRVTHEWARADNEYRKAKANAFLASEGTVDARRAQVDKVCEVERYAAHLAEGLMNAAKERVRATMAQLSAGQTMATVLRSEMQMSGRYD